MKNFAAAIAAAIRAGFWEGVYASTNHPKHAVKAYVATATFANYHR